MVFCFALEGPPTRCSHVLARFTNRTLLLPVLVLDPVLLCVPVCGSQRLACSSSRARSKPPAVRQRNRVHVSTQPERLSKLGNRRRSNPNREATNILALDPVKVDHTDVTDLRGNKREREGEKSRKKESLLCSATHCARSETLVWSMTSTAAESH